MSRGFAAGDGRRVECYLHGAPDMHDAAEVEGVSTSRVGITKSPGSNANTCGNKLSLVFVEFGTLGAISEQFGANIVWVAMEPPSTSTSHYEENFPRHSSKQPSSLNG
eukprot:5519166-Amphidinium_carterae.1